jgi:hypothetical protein
MWCAEPVLEWMKPHCAKPVLEWMKPHCAKSCGTCCKAIAYNNLPLLCDPHPQAGPKVPLRKRKTERERERERVN